MRVRVLANKRRRFRGICVTWKTVWGRKRKRVRCEGDETKKGTRRATKTGWPADTRAKTKNPLLDRICPYSSV